MSFEIVSHPGVSKRMNKALRGAVAQLNVVSPACENLRVEFVPAPVVQCENDGSCGFAVFHYALNSEQRSPAKDHPTILVGAKWVPAMRQDDITATDWVIHAVENLAHEWVHMEQYRDGRSIQERGVAVRMKTLCQALVDHVVAKINARKAAAK